MKAFLFLSLFLPLSAWCAPNILIPDCWTVDGKSIGLNRDGKEIADGHFIIMVDTKKATLPSLLSTMQKANSGNLQALGYPVIFPNLLFITSHAVDYSVPHMERSSLKQAVLAQLTELVKPEGVTLECDGIARPAPGR